MMASRQTVGCVVLLAVDAVAVVFVITFVVNTMAFKINDFVFHTVAFKHVLSLVTVRDLIVFIVDVILNIVDSLATVALSVVDDDVIVIVDVVLTVVVDVVLTDVGAIVFLDEEDAIGFVAAAHGESLGVGCCYNCRCSCRCS